NAVLRQHEEIDRLNEELAPFVIFKGIESEIHPDGSLDYRDAVLEKFDFVIVSVHAASRPNCAEMTERVCRALALPYSTILGHPSGRLLLQREPFDLDMEQILACAAEHGAAVELNANPRRLDLDWSYHQTAKRLGIPVPVCPDAHAIDGIADIRYGIASARKGLLTAEDVLTCWPVVRVRDFFHRRKRGLASARHKL
ncbi:MAG TPA: hypothetical protein PLP17_04070, partial [Oligoflexia bacterium]|nr:hypothetical protein [Oligoflexia bacterium]